MISDERYKICMSCDWLRPSTKQCKKCNCFVLLKSQFKTATCPIRKW